MNVLQQPFRMQRVEARGRIGVRSDGHTTRLADLFQEGSARIRIPKHHGAAESNALEAVLINTAGGMTGGDFLSWQASAGEGARLSLTTQACEKVYKAGDGTAKVDVTLRAMPGARIAWLPQETILFDRAAFSRTMNIDLASDADCLIVESLLLGRRAMGETVRHATFRDHWRIRVEGQLVHGEDFRFEGDASSLFSRLATGNGAGAMATILVVGERAEAYLSQTRALIANHAANGSGIHAGASCWRVGSSGKLLARVLAEDGYRLRSLLQPLIGLLNGKAGLPKIWSS
ncbi:MAG: urease accessory protein UreD [Salaquimonas sp.]|nr:urease accessory protein UreD [Salaquimonas sp.]